MATTTPQLVEPRKHAPLAHSPRPAGFFSRTVAFIIDLVILSIVQVLGSAFVDRFLGFFRRIEWVSKVIAVLDNPTYSVVINAVVVALVVIGYYIFFWTLVGFTIGKAVLGLKIVKKDGTKIGFGRSIIRFFGYWISALPFFLGFFWVLWDANSRGWHDKIAGTQVLYIPRNAHK